MTFNHLKSILYPLLRTVVVDGKVRKVLYSDEAVFAISSINVVLPAESQFDESFFEETSRLMDWVFAYFTDEITPSAWNSANYLVALIKEIYEYHDNVANALKQMLKRSRTLANICTIQKAVTSLVKCWIIEEYVQRAIPWRHKDFYDETTGYRRFGVQDALKPLVESRYCHAVNVMKIILDNWPIRSDMSSKIALVSELVLRVNDGGVPISRKQWTQYLHILMYHCDGFFLFFEYLLQSVLSNGACIFSTNHRGESLWTALRDHGNYFEFSISNFYSLEELAASSTDMSYGLEYYKDKVSKPAYEMLDLVHNSASPQVERMQHDWADREEDLPFVADVCDMYINEC